MAIVINCPFKIVAEDQYVKVECPYMDEHQGCVDIEVCPGNGDAWCYTKIDKILGLEAEES